MILIPLVFFGAISASPIGCVGAEIGEGCIGIPTPHSRPYHYDDHDRDNYHVDRRHHERHHHDDDDED